MSKHFFFLWLLKTPCNKDIIKMLQEHSNASGLFMPLKFKENNQMLYWEDLELIFLGSLHTFCKKYIHKNKEGHVKSDR